MIEVNELVLTGGHSEVPRHTVCTGKLVIVVIERLPPVIRRFSLEDGHQTAPLHVCWNLHPCGIKEGLREVEV